MSKSLFKRIGTSVVALSLVISSLSAVTASAEDSSDFQPSVTYTKGDYTFGKLSHPDKPVSTPDGIVDYLGGGNVAVTGENGATGQGDQGQSYAWSAASYGDWMYVGTCYAAMGNTLELMDTILGDNFDPEIMRAALKAMFNGTFFYGHEKADGTLDEDSGGILVKVNVKTGETKLLMSESTTGQGPLFRNAIRFNDKLYFCGSVRAKGQKSGLPSIYCVDPETDKINCVYTGITPAEAGAAYKEGISTGIRGMAVFDGEFIASCVGVDGPYILKSSDPSAGQSSFKKIATKSDLFNYPAYHYTDSIYGGSIWEMVEFNGSLYVALCTGTQDNKPDEHTMQSFAIVRGDENSDGSWTWTPVVGDKSDGARYTFGIDPERTRAGACNMLVYNDHLYIGEYEDIEIALEDVVFNKNVEFLAKNLEQSVSLYRMDKNENMELVVGDATEMFPNGGISGLSSGFGHHENQYIWQSTVYDGKMYFGTFDSSSLLEPIGQFTNGDLLNMTPEEWESQINYLKVLVELLLNKYLPEYPNQPLTADNTDSDDTVQPDSSSVEDEADNATVGGNTSESNLSSYEMVQNAIASATKRYSTAQAATYASEKDEDNAITLSDEQLDALMSGLENGSIKPNSLTRKLSTDLVELLLNMDPLSSSIDEQGSQDFVDEYSAIYDYYTEFDSELPDKLKELLDILITITKKDNLIAFGKVLCYLGSAERGFDLYTSEDGASFTSITTNGFGDPYNHGLRTFATGDDWMVIGTANPFYGTQLWKMTSPSKTVDPVDPSEPDKPVDPEKPSNPVKPSDPVKPTPSITPITSGTSSTTLTGKKFTPVKTGDMTNPIVPLAIAGGSLIVIIGAVFVLRKKKH